MTTTRTETLSDPLQYGTIKVLLALQPYSMQTQWTERVRRHLHFSRVARRRAAVLARSLDSLARSDDVDEAERG